MGDELEEKGTAASFVFTRGKEPPDVNYEKNGHTVSSESNFRFLSLRFQIKNFCIFVLNWFWPKYGNRLKLHELSNDLSKGESQGGSTLPGED